MVLVAGSVLGLVSKTKIVEQIVERRAASKYRKDRPLIALSQTLDQPLDLTLGKSAKKGNRSL